MNLADIVQGNWLKEFATATPATFATLGPEIKPTVAGVATVAVASQIAVKTIILDDPFLARRDWLHRAGLNEDDAALMAYRLDQRDLSQDDRRLCIECSHLFGGAATWRCSQWQLRQQNSPDLPNDLVTVVMHRCPGFHSRFELFEFNHRKSNPGTYMEEKKQEPVEPITSAVPSDKSRNMDVVRREGVAAGQAALDDGQVMLIGKSFDGADGVHAATQQDHVAIVTEGVSKV